MNGIDRNLGVVGKHLKHIKLTFTFISLIVLLAVSSIALVANAQEVNDEESAVIDEPVGNNAGNANSENKAEASSQKAGGRGNLSERAQERIRNLAANVSNRTEATISRLENISNRLDSRLTKISNENPEADLSVARNYLEEARINLTAASEMMGGIDTQVNRAVGSENPFDAWLSVRNRYKMAKQSIVSAHRSLKNAVVETHRALSGDVTNQTSDVSEDDMEFTQE